MAIFIKKISAIPLYLLRNNISKPGLVILEYDLPATVTLSLDFKLMHVLGLKRGLRNNRLFSGTYNYRTC